MFYETEKYEKTREKFLQREAGKEEKQVLELIKAKKGNNKVNR